MNALFDAKAQYNALLHNKMADVVYDIFQSMYTRAQQLKGGETLVGFQTMVKDVQNWNMTQIQEAVDTVEKHCGPRFINQCLKAIFFLNAKILSSYENEQDIQLRIPAIKDFIYDVVLDTAKTMYRHPSVYSVDVDPEQHEQNVESIYRQIFKSIDRCVEKSFPYENFLRVYDKQDDDTAIGLDVSNPLGSDGDEAQENEEEEKDEEREITYGGGADMPDKKPVLHSDVEDDAEDSD
jgi:hypothetical protein